VNSELPLTRRQSKLLAVVEEQMPPGLKRRMTGGVFILIVLAANAALAVLANAIVRLPH
jgi:hypothetical protein